jgi:hypothetical protein
MNRLQVLWLALLLHLPVMATAQARFETGVSFTTGFPQGAFGDNLNSTGLGASFDGFVRIKSSPVFVGASLGFVVYSSETVHAPFSPTIPVLVPVTAMNNGFMGSLIVRWQPGISWRSPVSPYVEAFGGFDHLWTQTTIGESSGQVVTSNLSDTAMTFGPGAGVSIRMLEVFTQGVPTFRMDLNVGARYVLGGSADYRRGPGTGGDDGAVVRGASRSRTDLLTLDVGFGFRF